MHNTRQRFYSEWRSHTDSSPLENLSRFYPESPKLANLELAEGLEDLILEESEDDFQGFNLDQIDGSMGVFQAPQNFQFIGEDQLRQDVANSSKIGIITGQSDNLSVDSFEIIIEQRKANLEGSKCHLDCCEDTHDSVMKTRTQCHHPFRTMAGNYPQVKLRQTNEMDIRIRSEIDSSLNTENTSAPHVAKHTHRKIFKIEDQNCKGTIQKFEVADLRNNPFKTNLNANTHTDAAATPIALKEANSRDLDTFSDLELDTASMLCVCEEGSVSKGMPDVSFHQHFTPRTALAQERPNLNTNLTNQSKKRNYDMFRSGYTQITQNQDPCYKDTEHTQNLLKLKNPISNLQNRNKSGVQIQTSSKQKTPGNIISQAAQNKGHFNLKKIKTAPKIPNFEGFTGTGLQGVFQRGSNLLAECFQTNRNPKPRQRLARNRSKSFMQPNSRKIFDFMKRRY